MKAVLLFACGLGVALCSGPFAAVGADVPVRVEAKKIVILDCGYAKLQEELKRTLDYITDGDVKILKPAHVPPFGSFVIRLGQAPVKTTEQLLEEGDETAAPRAKGQVDWQVDEKGVRIWGELRRGVFAFLNRELGVEWPWYDAIVAEKRQTLVFAHRRGSWTPSFGLRNLRGRGNDAFIDWRERNLDGNDGMVQAGHAFTSWWFRFCDDHPEFFAQRPDGVRGPFGMDAKDIMDPVKAGRKQVEHIPLCLSSEGLADAVIAEWRKAGAPDKINLCENDARPWEVCACAACAALDGVPPERFGGRAVDKNGWPGWRSDRSMTFCSRVLEKARAINPNVRGCAYAYNTTELPPQKTKVPENLVAGIVPTSFTRDYVFALVDGWKAAGLKEYYLRPNRRVYFNFRFLPVGYDRYFFDLLKELHAKGGLVGLDSDGPAAGSRQHYMECWYLLKFLQDPTKDFAHWERLWCSFFGPAADDVAKYYAYWREEVWEKRFVPQLDKLDIGAAKSVYANLGRYYREQDFVTAGAHLERGLGRADLGPVARKMLEDLKTDNEHGRIFVRAWIGRTPEQVRDLVDYRKTHGLPSHWGYEKEFLELSTKDCLFSGTNRLDHAVDFLVQTERLFESH